MSTVSTDDAYVAGHVTYIASRVPGTILKVHVDDNQFVNKGQLLVEIDPEPYQIAAEPRQCGRARWPMLSFTRPYPGTGHGGRHPGGL